MLAASTSDETRRAAARHRRPRPRGRFQLPGRPRRRRAPGAESSSRAYAGLLRLGPARRLLAQLPRLELAGASSASPTGPASPTRAGSPSDLIAGLCGRRGRSRRDHLQRLRLAAHPGVHARDAAAAAAGGGPRRGRTRQAEPSARRAQGTARSIDYEPEPEEILARLIPDYVEISIYRALLESTASEHGARMTAMRNASENAGDLIDDLTLRDEPRASGRDHPGDHGSRRRRRGPRLDPGHRNLRQQTDRMTVQPRTVR